MRSVTHILEALDPLRHKPTPGMSGPPASGLLSPRLVGFMTGGCGGSSHMLTQSSRGLWGPTAKALVSLTLGSFLPLLALAFPTHD